MAGRNGKTGHRRCCKSSGASLKRSVREALEGNHEDPRLPKFDAGSGNNVTERRSSSGCCGDDGECSGVRVE